MSSKNKIFFFASPLLEKIFFFFVFIFFASPFSIYAQITEDQCKIYPKGECYESSSGSTTDICPDGKRPVTTCIDTITSTTAIPHCCVENTNNWAPAIDTDSCLAQNGECKDNLCPQDKMTLGVCDTDDGVCCDKDRAPSISTSNPVNASFDYTPLEPIPGIDPEDSKSFEGFIESIYIFALWSVGIAALFMLTIGGFWYMTSAGNTSRIGEAKKIIASALVGLLIALITWLILYVLNPDLVRINIDLTNFFVAGSTSHLYPSTGPGAGPGNGQCEPVPSGSCSIENLKKTCLASNAEVFSNICNVESGGKEDAASTSDVCKDGYPFSWGLFQINLTVHSLNGLNCPKAFDGKNFQCTVINKSLYDQCVQAAKNPSININYSCKISNNGQNVGPWLNTSKKCGYL